MATVICNCLKELDAKVKEHTKDEDACVDWVVSGLFGNDVLYLPKINYTFRKFNSRGEPTKKTFDGTIVPTFCPFCGKKYRAEK